MLYNASEEYRSLRKISAEAKSEHSLTISKQGLDSRFSKESVAFSKCILEEALKEQVTGYVDLSSNQLFKRVLIKDSTRFDIHESLKEQFPGFGGDSSKAGVSLQFEYDLKNGKVSDLDLQSELDRDCKDARLKKASISAGDLIIRDLGYYSIDVIKTISQNGGYFISRLYQSAKVYLSPETKEEIYFDKIYNQMKSQHILSQELNVYTGKERFPMRLVISLLPDDVYQKRVRKRKRLNKQQGFSTSQSYKARAHFNLFVCNISANDLSMDDICNLYKTRWQIELVFKTWKSLLNIHKTRKMKYERFVTTIYMNLVWIIIHWKILIPLRNYLYFNKTRLVSLFKCIDTLAGLSRKIRQLLRESSHKGYKTIHQIFDLLSSNHWLEHRNNRQSFEEINHLLFCISSDY